MKAEDDRLERLWDATSPTAPSAEAWDRVWAKVGERLDEPAAPDVVPPLTLVMPSAPRRRWAAVAAILVAQAAAVLLAAGIALHGHGPAPDALDVSRQATAAVRVEEGQLVLIRSNADALEVTDLSLEAGAAGVDAWYLVYNLLESMAGPVVAMSE